MPSITVLTLWVAKPEMFCNFLQDLMEPKSVVELITCMLIILLMISYCFSLYF